MLVAPVSARGKSMIVSEYNALQLGLKFWYERNHAWKWLNCKEKSSLHQWKRQWCVQSDAQCRHTCRSLFKKKRRRGCTFLIVHQFSWPSTMTFTRRSSADFELHNQRCSTFQNPIFNRRLSRSIVSMYLLAFSWALLLRCEPGPSKGKWNLPHQAQNTQICPAGQGFRISISMTAA